MPATNNQKLNRGVLTVWVLIFGTMFLIMLGGIMGYVVNQMNYHQGLKNKNAALEIAEAGLNYARWHLAHDDANFGFGGIYDYKDPEGGNIGQYQLEITPPSGCNSSILIKSTGWKTNSQKNQRILRIRYAKPALARYGFLTHANAWFGPNEELRGPFHSNGGVRMDGSQNSLSTSARTTYVCGSEHGCDQAHCSSPCSWLPSPTNQCQCPGIWGSGSGGGAGLWQFPVSNVNFDALTQNLLTLRNLATSSGIYFASSTVYGYHMVLKSNGTFDLYKVKQLKPPVNGHTGLGWVFQADDIKKEDFIANYVLPVNCSPVFVEDNLWINGVVNGRVTVVAARLPDLSDTNAKIIIPDNITNANATSTLGLITQKDILVPLIVPEDMQIHAVMLAQKGHVWRLYYPKWNFEPYKTYAIRDRIETYGSIISYDIWTFTWVDEGGTVLSGFPQTSMNYDVDLTYDPPPYFPVSGDYEIIRWEEVE